MLMQANLLAWTRIISFQRDSTLASELSKFFHPPYSTSNFYPHQPVPNMERSFAWAEMRMVAANVLSRFDVVEVPGQHVDFRQYITMQFATGHWKVMLKPRQQ